MKNQMPLDLEPLILRMRLACFGEREQLLLFLDGLAIVDAQAIHLGLGYSNLFEFCRLEFGLAEGSIYRRIQVARQFRAHPELRAALKEHRINLTQCSLICPLLGRLPTEKLIDLVSGHSKRKVQQIIADLIPDLDSQPLGASRDGLRYVGKGRSILRVSLGEKLHRALEKFRQDLAKNERLLDWSEVLERLLVAAEQSRNIIQAKVPVADSVWLEYESDSRYIPKNLKEIVLNRAEHRCMFLAKDGRRCSQDRFLEIDHIHPMALGGKTKLENLQVLCKSHNLYKGILNSSQYLP